MASRCLVGSERKETRSIPLYTPRALWGVVWSSVDGDTVTALHKPHAQFLHMPLHASVCGRNALLTNHRYPHGGILLTSARSEPSAAIFSQQTGIASPHLRCERAQTTEDACSDTEEFVVSGNKHSLLSRIHMHPGAGSL